MSFHPGKSLHGLHDQSTLACWTLTFVVAEMEVGSLPNDWHDLDECNATVRENHSSV